MHIVFGVLFAGYMAMLAILGLAFISGELNNTEKGWVEMTHGVL